MKILITGGSSQIAQAIIKHRTKDECCYTFSEQDSVKLDKAQAIHFNFLQAAEHAKNLPTNIDALILNAATYTPPRRRLHEMKLENIQQTIQADLMGNIFLLHHYLPQMVEKKLGKIIFISSVSVQTGTSRYPVYVTVKAALEGLMRNLVVDYSAHGITTNTLRLGLFKTERTKFFWENPSYQEKVQQLIPSGRMGEPNDVVSVIDTLLDNPYLNGAEITLAGGLPLLAPQGN